MAAVEAVDPAPVATAPEDVEMAVAEAGSSETNGAAANGGDTRASRDDPEKVQALSQIEFYFADSNLPYDRFMWTLHTANAEHWVPIATVASFKRMRQFQSKGVPWLADALRQSESLLEVDEMGKKVRRREEVREPKGQFERSVYAKGFGEETPTLQVELEAFFSKYGKVNAVRMRRLDGLKGFKGSVFCEFANFEDVKKFLEADPKPQWNGNDLLIMSKDAYCEMKIKEKGLTGRAAQNKRSTFIASQGFNAFKMDDKIKEMSKKKPETQEGPEIYLEFMGTRLKVNQKDGGSVVEADVPFTKGASLKFSGCGGGYVFTDIKATLKERFKRPPYVDHKRGAVSGIIGFDKTLSDEDIDFVREHLKILNGNSITWEIPDEDSEKEFQIERAQSAARRIISGEGEGSSGRGRGRGRRGRRGSRGGHGRGGGGGRGGRKGDFGGSKEAKEETADQPGEKRKRAVEPDGGPDTKGQGVPVIHTSKKAKTDTKETGDGDS